MPAIVTLPNGEQWSTPVFGGQPGVADIPGKAVKVSDAPIGYGISGYNSSTGTINAPSAMESPTYNAPAPYQTPAAYEKGNYVAPTYDEQRVRDLAQTSGAASMRGLRSQMQKVTGGSYANPNVKRMTLRDALAGYGQGVQAAMSGATDTARNLYNTEYTGKVNENQLNFQAGEQAKATNYATAQQKAQMEYQGGLSSAQAQFQAAQAKANTEYQTMWNNYNQAQSRLLAQQKSASTGSKTVTNYAPSVSWDDYIAGIRNS